MDSSKVSRRTKPVHKILGAHMGGYRRWSYQPASVVFRYLAIMGSEFDQANDCTEEERAAMTSQMQDECCANSSTLDLDQVLKSLENTIPQESSFTRIGPFGIWPVAKAAESCQSDAVYTMERKQETILWTLSSRTQLQISINC